MDQLKSLKVLLDDMLLSTRHAFQGMNCEIQAGEMVDLNPKEYPTYVVIAALTSGDKHRTLKAVIKPIIDNGAVAVNALEVRFSAAKHLLISPGQTISLTDQEVVRFDYTPNSDEHAAEVVGNIVHRITAVYAQLQHELKPDRETFQSVIKAADQTQR